MRNVTGVFVQHVQAARLIRCVACQCGAAARVFQQSDFPVRPLEPLRFPSAPQTAAPPLSEAAHGVAMATSLPIFTSVSSTPARGAKQTGQRNVLLNLRCRLQPVAVLFV